MQYNIVAFIVDAALAVLLLGSIYFVQKKGFAAGLISLGGNLASLLAAWFGSSRLAPIVFDRFFRQSISDKILQIITENGWEQVQEKLQGLLWFLGDKAGEITDTLQQSAQSSAMQAVTAVLQNVVEPLLIPLLSIVIFVVLYALCRLLIKLLVAVFAHINDVPLVGGLNRFGGVLLGLAIGALNVFIALCAVWMILIVTGNAIPFFNTQQLQSSLFYTAFLRLGLFFA